MKARFALTAVVLAAMPAWAGADSPVDALRTFPGPSAATREILS
jgi:hypothetical protein